MTRSNAVRRAAGEASASPARRPPRPPAPPLRELRVLLRRSPLLTPSLRAHWLQVLPHLSDEQRRELADVLQSTTAAE